MKCNNINCYVEKENVICLANNSNYNSTFQSINCDYSNENKSISLSAYENQVHVESIFSEVFVKILAEVKQINEIKIPNIKVDNFSYATFKGLENLTSLTIMNPKNIEENSFLDILEINQFRLFVICPHNQKEKLGLSTLLLKTNKWKIILFYCHGIYKCQFYNCNNINSITLKSDHQIQWNNTKITQIFSTYNCSNLPCQSTSQMPTKNATESTSQMPTKNATELKSQEAGNAIIIILVVCASVIILTPLILYVTIQKVKRWRFQKSFHSTQPLFINYDDF